MELRGKRMKPMKKVTDSTIGPVRDFTEEQKSVEIHTNGLLGVNHCKQLLSEKGYQISEQAYRADILTILPTEKVEKLGFRFAWCEVMRTHPSSSKKRKFLKEWMGEEGGLFLINQETGEMKIERLNHETIITSIYSDYL